MAKSTASTASNSGSNSPFRIDIATLTMVGLGAISGLVVFVVTANLLSHFRTYSLVIAAGNAQGESYIISTALAEVVKKYNPRIRLTVQETGGTTENLKLLDTEEVAFAAAQADVPPGNSAKIVANLYSDKFHLLATAQSGIRSFGDLRGKRIALPQSGGQFQSFLQVAAHFGLKETDFQFIGATEEEGSQAFIKGAADAAFRVRAASNGAVRLLAQGGKVLFIPIDQAAAMQIKYPAFQPSSIPQGTYQGIPPLPQEDLSTVAVDRILLTHDRVPDAVVYAIAETLINRRQEIADRIPDQNAEVRTLVANFQEPGQGNGLGVPLHPGAQAFYERHKPSFIVENSDFLGLGLTIILLLWSWIAQLKKILENRQKNQADQYSSEVVSFLEQAQVSQTLQDLERIRHDLLTLLTNAVRDLDQDRISEESFQSFRVVWQIALDVTRERYALLVRQTRQTVATGAMAAGQDSGT